jgi:hypothetical protein
VSPAAASAVAVESDTTRAAKSNAAPNVSAARAPASRRRAPESLRGVQIRKRSGA